MKMSMELDKIFNRGKTQFSLETVLSQAKQDSETLVMRLDELTPFLYPFTSILKEINGVEKTFEQANAQIKGEIGILKEQVNQLNEQLPKILEIINEIKVKVEKKTANVDLEREILEKLRDKI